MSEDVYSRTYTKRLTQESAGGPESKGEWLVESFQDAVKSCLAKAEGAMLRHAEREGMRAQIIANTFCVIARDEFPCVQARCTYRLVRLIPALRVVK